MTQKDNILQELNELKSTLNLAARQNVYTAPAGYFDGLAAQVLSRIKAMEAADAAEELDHLSPVLKGMSKQIPYSVPSGYFEGLAENAIAAAKSTGLQTDKEELESISPLLSGLKKEMPYAVPQGYFESLTKNSIAEENKPVLSTMRGAKVIPLTHRKWFRYAAAAVVAGLVAISGLLMFNTKEKTAVILGKVEKDVKNMDETQKDNLADFIDAGMNGKETAQVNNAAKTSEIKSLLQGISEEELKAFEQQTEDLGEVLMTD
jgi:hypothetical protein